MGWRIEDRGFVEVCEGLDGSGCKIRCFLSNQISTQGVLRWLRGAKQEIHGDRSKMTMKNQKVVENIILKHPNYF